MNSQAGGVYAVVNTTDGKNTAYVGSAIYFKERWRKHKSALRGGYHHNTHLQRAWDKYGAEAFRFIVLELLDSTEPEALLACEQRWLDMYKEAGAIYNIVLEVNKSPMWGRRHTEESKKAMSVSQRRRPPLSGEALERRSLASKRNWLDPEIRRRIIEGMAGHIISESTRRKISASLMGHPVSEEARQKIRSAHLGRSPSQEHRAKISQRLGKPYPAFKHQETKEIIPAGVGLRAMCRKYELQSGRMSRVARGLAAHHAGWELLEVEHG